MKENKSNEMDYYPSQAHCAQHTVYIARRKDLKYEKQKKSFRDISATEITNTIKNLAESSFVFFIDTDGSTKLMKNRYGSDGIVVSETQYDDYMRLLQKEAQENIKKLQEDENNQLNSRTKKKSFLGRFFGTGS